LVCGQRDSGQNADDGHHYHQLDQGETLLHRTLHKKLLGKKVSVATYRCWQNLCQYTVCHSLSFLENFSMF
jgi:hypothetical protein